MSPPMNHMGGGYTNGHGHGHGHQPPMHSMHGQMNQQPMHRMTGAMNQPPVHNMPPYPGQHMHNMPAYPGQHPPQHHDYAHAGPGGYGGYGGNNAYGAGNGYAPVRGASFPPSPHDGMFYDRGYGGGGGHDMMQCYDDPRWGPSRHHDGYFDRDDYPYDDLSIGRPFQGRGWGRDLRHRSAGLRGGGPYRGGVYDWRDGPRRRMRHEEPTSYVCTVM